MAMLNSCHGAGGLALDAGKAAEDEQGNRRDRNLVELCHHAMAQLMKHHAGEEKDAGDDPERPVLRRGPTGVLRETNWVRRDSVISRKMMKQVVCR